ncbi:helix-turn-helix domain-containing protein [Sphingomonas echinoides]|uniref:helix-turn-helix domain-containing protein n=1 Tax=Sphingomonas echinoides TaxID=59803 RepID=UPI002412F1B5|nr:helix-turn-helix domain-containing protein [Sphingomonas echinoides]
MATRPRDNRQELYDAGKSDRQIARELGKDRKSIWRWRTNAGLPPLQKRLSPLPKEERERRIAFHLIGLNDVAMAMLCNITRQTMQEWRTYYSLPVNHKHNNKAPLPAIQMLSMDVDAGYGSMHRRLRDDSWSSWLEEMGATVC